MRKTTTFFAFVCLTLGLHAQFVRTDMGDLGDSQQYRKADTTGVGDGSAGAGQNWDFSTLVATNLIPTNSYVVPSLHPQGSAYPTANVAFSPANDAWQFYESSADSLYMIGEKSPTNTRITYTDGAAWFRYPQAFSVPNTDNVLGTYPDGFISTVTRRGTIQTVFDGDGSLITPFATYPSVKRVEYSAVYFDSSHTGAANVDVSLLRYEWYASTQTMPVLIIHHQEVIVNGGNPQITKEIYWADPNAVAVTPEVGDRFELYPNPSQGRAQLRYAIDAAGEVRVEILNLLGERVRLVVDETQSAGTYQYDLGAGLSKGIYMVRMQDVRGTSTQKLILN